MRSKADHELLQAIFDEMQELKKAMQIKDDRRVNVKEFAERLCCSETTLWTRIKSGAIQEPFKDGRFNFWLNSYVNEVVTQPLNSDKVAA
ncbi:helix-turn-helix transcriptional regulator [Acinetobacter sp. CS-2]|uniref:helix-turn-helix transcriptional regulator n=1 Tax=Acinetobacter sp. CS-2 TaxID=2798861 RepID=UPI001908ACF9|nr:hypothetical protein [Acinetobacter sp. CS-2]QQN40289.1 hypothetical protein JFY49_05030 [Acinetobacter sp. CS-2]